MIMMAVLEVIFMNGIFICIAVTALAVALLGVVQVPYIIIVVLATLILILSLVFLRPMIKKYMSNKIDEMNKKYKEVVEGDESQNDDSQN